PRWSSCTATVLVSHCHALFLYWWPPRPHLHSFPTRRSSDLSFRERVRAAATRSPLRSRRRRSAGARRRLRAAARRPCAHRSGGSDRKSTRLNSSHVAISYAVFCLKKKKHGGGSGGAGAMAGT